MQVVWEYLVHEENENRCLDKGDTLFRIRQSSVNWYSSQKKCSCIMPMRMTTRR